MNDEYEDLSNKVTMAVMMILGAVILGFGIFIGYQLCQIVCMV